MHLKKLALIVEYDGTRFHGFQLQARGNTVQEELEQAIEAFTGEDLRVTAASRTDAGVHALGQVVSFRTRVPYSPETFVSALNHHLPEDIAVHGAWEIPAWFNVRTKAVSRCYEYWMRLNPARSALLRYRALDVTSPLELEGMSEAASMLVGEHDFASFVGSLVPKQASTRRELSRAEFRRRDDLLIFDVEGDSFLHQQVRRMAGALLEVGRGRLTVAEFGRFLSEPSRGTAGPTLPPQALYLKAVRYDSPPLGGSDQETTEKK
jgi:tRNA pseudouridine38-40 synthase